MYAITGITGRVGGAIAENPLAQGEQIRAIVRDPGKATRWRDREPVQRWERSPFQSYSCRKRCRRIS